MQFFQPSLNAQTDQASWHLLKKVIPALAAEIFEKSSTDDSPLDVCDALHSVGVNLRYLGLLFDEIQNLGEGLSE